MDALSACVDNTAVSLDDKYIVLVLLLLFYITTQQSNTLINQSASQPCNELINNNLYSDFISSFVFWVISFILIIIIKYYGINTINSFTFNEVAANIKHSSLPSPGKTIGDEVKRHIDVNIKSNWADPGTTGLILRSKYVGQTLLSIITNILNVAYVILILLTLYKIIDKLLDLIECKTEICTKDDLCGMYEDGGDAEYYNDEKCYDENKKEITKKKKTEVLAEDTAAYASASAQSSNRLEEDFRPPLIKYFLETWTPIGDITYFKVNGFYYTSIILTAFLLLYIKQGVGGNDYFKGAVIILMGNVILNSVVMLMRALGGATYEQDDKTISGSGYVVNGSIPGLSWDNILKGLSGLLMCIIFGYGVFVGTQSKGWCGWAGTAAAAVVQVIVSVVIYNDQ